MSSDAGSPYLLLIKAALAAGVRPTTMILGADNRKRWSEMDVLVMQAYQILEIERCPSCGNYVWMCGNEDPRLYVKIVKNKCFAEKELRQYNKDHPDDEDTGKPVFHNPRDDTPLHEFRALYYQQKERERAGEGAEDAEEPQGLVD